MDSFYIAYIATYLLACLVALWLYWKDPVQFYISRKTYWRFVSEPWKLISFGIAATGMVVVGPYTVDPTWDYIDAGFMSVFTYATAPWVMGVLYRLVRGRESLKQAFVAACAWLFSASWSYDLYILWRDGDYPATWLPNIFAASVLYVSAGLLWNLEWAPGRGVIFGFMREDWPAPLPQSGFRKLAWFALPFMAIAAASVLYFLR